MLVVELGVMQALNRGRVREFTSPSKGHHWSSRKLKSDRP